MDVDRDKPRHLSAAWTTVGRTMVLGRHVLQVGVGGVPLGDQVYARTDARRYSVRVDAASKTLSNRAA
jgi:hypothetical protein